MANVIKIHSALSFYDSMWVITLHTNEDNNKQYLRKCPKQTAHILQLLKKKWIDENEYEDLWYEKDKDDLPKFLMTTEDFLSENQDHIDEIYQRYATAMQRRYRDPLAPERFISHFFNGESLDETYIYGDFKEGFVLWSYRCDIFIPTHFAPKTLRGGYKLMKDLGESQEIPALLAITDDIADTLKKLPTRHIEDVWIKQYFRGELVKKQIAYNSHPNILDLLPQLVGEFLQEQENRYNDDDDQDEEDNSF